MKATFQRYPLVAYFLLTYAISWPIFIILGLAKNGVIQADVPYGIHYLASFGPMISALIVTSLIQGSDGVKSLLKRMVQWRAGFIWWVAAFIPIILYLLTTVALRLINGEWTDFSVLGDMKFLPPLGILGAFVIWCLTYGLGEETGWRGFALPRMQKNRSALSASLLLWLFWATWHIPSFFYLHEEINVMFLVGFFLGMLCGSIIFTWLLNSTAGSLIFVSIFHGALDYTTAAEGLDPAIAASVSTLVMVMAVILLIVFKPANLSRSEKFTL